MTRTITGTVLSTKMTNTIVVMVERKLRHPLYRKVITRHKKFKAHNEKANVKVGDVVSIRETRPLSKDIHFAVVDDTNVQTKPEVKKEAPKAVVAEQVKPEVKKTVKKAKVKKAK